MPCGPLPLGVGRSRGVPGWRFAALLALAGVAGLAGPLPARATGTEPTDARSWLARIHAAANERNYQGTMIFSASGMLSSSRVAHFAVGDQSYERLEALDGRQQRVYRLNDTVHTLWPQTRVAVIEKRTPFSGLASLRQVVEPRALEQYELRPEGPDRVAGRDAKVFLLQPRDQLRYAQRLWADRDTGLMLRADILGAQGAVLESSAFSEVEIGIRPQPDSVSHAVRQLAGWRVVRRQQQHVRLDAEGWAVARPVPGFALSGCVKRALAPSIDTATEETVLQAVFSDGLTHVSVFIEPRAARGAFRSFSAQIGATGTYREQREDHWITVLGDVPAATLKQFAQALERRR